MAAWIEAAPRARAPSDYMGNLLKWHKTSDRPNTVPRHKVAH